MKQQEFLKTVVTTPEGYFLLATRDMDTGWKEHFFDWPNQLDCIIEATRLQSSQRRDVYFSAHLFEERRSTKNCVLPTRTIQADLDHAEYMSMPVIPSVIVQTSEGRHQGYWVLNETHMPPEIEDMSRRIAYGVRDCDRTGWPVGHRMRMPETMNFKYLSPQQIEVIGHTLKSLDPEAFHLFPELATTLAQAELDTDWINQGHVDLGVGPAQLMHDAKLSSPVTTGYDKPHKDRSKYLWLLMNEAFRQGLSRDQVYHLAWCTPNNKFRDDRRYAAVADLKKDILRAESVALDRVLDMKDAIMDLRLLRGTGAVKKRLAMAAIVLARMREDGELIHTHGGQLWFMRRDTGRPIELAERSQWFDAYLQRTFALNSTETDARFVKQEIITHTRNQAASADLTTLTYFDQPTSTLLLHTGGRDVLHIKADGIETHPNGYAHTVFTVDQAVEPFKLGRVAELGGRPWYDFLFAPQMEHIDGVLTQCEAVALLRAWFLFILFRTHLTNRPILAIMGEPGAGKSVTAKKVYRLLYGRFRQLSTLKTEENFDTETINFPFVAYDGVDTYERWLPDALSQAAGITEVNKRRLYTDVDTISQRRQALLMLTTHNPKFTREDVVDRLIIIMLKRLPRWLPEVILLEEVSCARNALWADIVRDVQAVLATPMPSPADAPQFRIEDYALYGMWFSRAAGLDGAFTSAINKLIGSQKGMNLETDQLLVDTIKRWFKNQNEHNHAPAFKQQTVLWNEWQACAADPLTFQKAYRNALYLGRKLTTLQDSLKQIMDVETEYQGGVGAKVWRIGPKSAPL